MLDFHFLGYNKIVEIKIFTIKTLYNILHIYLVKSNEKNPSSYFKVNSNTIL